MCNGFSNFNCFDDNTCLMPSHVFFNNVDVGLPVQYNSVNFMSKFKMYGKN